MVSQWVFAAVVSCAVTSTTIPEVGLSAVTHTASHMTNLPGALPELLKPLVERLPMRIDLFRNQSSSDSSSSGSSYRSSRGLVKLGIFVAIGVVGLIWRLFGGSSNE